MYYNFNVLELNHVSVLKPSKFGESFGLTNSEPISYKDVFKPLGIPYFKIRNLYVSDPDFLSHEFLKYELGCIYIQIHTYTYIYIYMYI